MAQPIEELPTDGDFAAHTAPYRRELLAHCYRMVGSIDEAEDLVQEVYLRAWRAFDRFEGRSSVRTWLYRIATNLCLTALGQRSRRWLPSGLGPATGEIDGVPPTPLSDVAWLEPIPDSLVQPEGDPASIVDFRGTVRLALVASLQYLPPRQRAVLLFRDMLGWSAAEVAAALDTTTAAVKSTLQRARARMGQVAMAAEAVHEPDEPELRALLDRFIAGFESADAAAIERLLRDDATIEAPPFPNWVAGKAKCGRYLAAVLGAASYRMVPTVANGQPAAVAYLRGPDGAYRAFGISVLTATPDGISRITAFCNAGLVGAFGYPEVMIQAGGDPDPYLQS